MKAFGIDIKKQDIRDLFADHGKDVKEGINFGEFTAMMSSRMVRNLLRRDREIQRMKFKRYSNCLMRTEWVGSRSKISEKFQTR